MIKQLATAAFVLGLAFDASASVITFNGLAGTAQPGASVYAGSSTTSYVYKPYTSVGVSKAVTVDGFVFTTSSSYNEYLMSSEYYTYSNIPSTYAGNGTDFLMGYNITMTSATNVAFSLGQVDLGWFTSTAPGTVTLTATKANGSVVTKSLTVAASNSTTTNDFTTFAFTDLMDLKSLQFVSANDYMAIDNITVNANAVPEPGTLALLGLGLAGLVARRRRK